MEYYGRGKKESMESRATLDDTKRKFRALPVHQTKPDIFKILILCPVDIHPEVRHWIIR